MQTRQESQRRLHRLYDSLSRYNWWRRRLSRTRPGTGLEMHKRLRAPHNGEGPGAGCARLNDWLWEFVEPGSDARILDIGCGFGATVLAWAQRGGGEFIGLTLSGYQVDKATGQARRLGLGRKCAFRRQGFDDPIDGRFDVIVSIESLFHTPDLPHTVHHLASITKPGGRLVLVEDMAVDDQVADDPAARSLLSSWSSDRLHTEADYRSSLATYFELDQDIDLTEQVDLPRNSDWDGRERRLRRLRRLTPFCRRTIDAFIGGIAMERLYARGLLRYRTMVARRVGGEAC